MIYEKSITEQCIEHVDVLLNEGRKGLVTMRNNIIVVEKDSCYQQRNGKGLATQFALDVREELYTDYKARLISCVAADVLANVIRITHSSQSVKLETKTKVLAIIQNYATNTSDTRLLKLMYSAFKAIEEYPYVDFEPLDSTTLYLEQMATRQLLNELHKFIGN